MPYFKPKDQLLEPLIRIIPEEIKPNHLSIARLILAVPIFIQLLSENYISALILFIVAAMLDLLDGPLARIRGQISGAGIILDPLADKIMFLSAFLILGASLVPLIIFAAILIVEIVAILGAIVLPMIPILRIDKEVLSPVNPLGQAKMFLYAVGMISLIISIFLPVIYSLSIIIFTIGLILAILSTVRTILPQPKKTP